MNERMDESMFGYHQEIDYDTRISLKDALDQLSPEYNEILYLREYENYSYKEIADITEQTLENVKIKIFRARRQLRKILS